MIAVILNIVVLSISVLLPYPCRPIYKFCKNFSGNLITKPKYFFFLLLCISTEILAIITSINGFGPMFDYYQTVMYVIGSLMGKCINLIALSLAGTGVTYISNESQKVLFLFNFMFKKKIKISFNVLSGSSWIS